MDIEINGAQQHVEQSEYQSLVGIWAMSQQILSEKPHDAAHDWEHHKAVAINCLKIVDGEGLWGQVNIVNLFKAALFHDLERGSKEHDVATQALRKSGCTDENLKEVVGLINEHSFNDKQVTLEGRILWAADKIEYVSKKRAALAMENLSKIELFFYIRLWEIRIKSVIAKFPSLGLPTASDIFKTRFGELKAYVESEKPEYEPLFRNITL
jgi:hypothetical protein